MAFLCVAAAAPGLARLRLRTDGHALVPAHAPQVLQDQAIRREFGLKDTIAVVVRSPDSQGIFNSITLETVDRLTTKFMNIGGLKPSDVFSLATEKGHRVKPGTLQFLRFFEPVPASPGQCATLRSDLRLIKIYDQVLVSADEKSTAILVGVPEGVDRIGLYRRIQEIIDSAPYKQDDIRVTGAPVAESLLGTHILEDLGVRPSWFGAVPTSIERISAGGVPKSLDELREFIAHHVGVLPIALAVMSIVFFVSFRSLIAAGLTLFKIGMCLSIVFGLMGWLDVPIYLTIAVMPVILTATGVSDEVHIFDHYARQLRKHPQNPNRSHAVEALLISMNEMWRPVVMTSVTTAVGFLSFALSPLAPVRAFGIFTAAGCMIEMVWALTATPALVVLIHPKRFRDADPGSRHALFSLRHSPLYAWMGSWVPRHRWAILVVFCALLAGAGLGIRRIRVQDSWIDGFSPASEFYKTTTSFNDQFLGMHVMFVCADTNSTTLKGELDSAEVETLAVRLPGIIVSDPAALVSQTIEMHRVKPPPDVPANAYPLFHRATIESATRVGDRIVAALTRTMGSPRFSLRLDQDTRVRYHIAPEPFLHTEPLGRIKALEEFIASCRGETVGGTLGPAKYVETTNFIGLGCREEHRRIPEQDRLEWVWKWYGTIRGPERLRATIDPDYSRGIISVFMKNANFVDTARLLQVLRDYERTHLAPHRISLSFAGDVAVSQALIDAIVRTQVQSLAMSLVGVLVVTVVLSRSLGWGALCVLPCALAVPLNFAVMGLLGIPLGVATSMFASMSVGVGVDYAIHFIERYRIVRAQTSSAEEAMGETMIVAGPANVIDALSVALGFGVLTLSQVPANARLGIMVLSSIITCLVSTLILLPALIPAIQPRRTPSALAQAATEIA